MLRITVEIVPFGDDAKARVIETLYIANRGKLLKECLPDTYVYESWRNYDPREKAKPKKGSITTHVRGGGALMLTATAILDMLKMDYSLSPQKKK